MKLSHVLALLLGGLSLLCIAATGGIAYHFSYSAMTRLTQQRFSLANQTVAGKIGELLDRPTRRIFDDLSNRVRRGMLPMQNPRDLALELAERIRVEPDLAWLSYADVKTGRFIGAERHTDGTISINISLPHSEGGGVDEEFVTAEGVTTPAPARTYDYDPRTFEWFTNAMKGDGPVWSKPYEFSDTDFGITASCAWRPPGATAPVGVFTVDFLIQTLDDTLAALGSGGDTYLCVIGPDGTIISAPNGSQRNQYRKMLENLSDDIAEEKGRSTSEINHLLNRTFQDRGYVVAFHHLKTSTGFDCVVASIGPADEVYAEANRAATAIALEAAIGFAFALGLGWSIAHRVSEPLRSLSADLRKVGDFQLEPGRQSPSFVQEVEVLKDAAERMKSGLRSFIRYVPDDLVRQVLRSGVDASLGGRMRTLTIFFSDIQGFTSYAEQVEPGRLVTELSAYFEVLTYQVRERHLGTIDKFIGDGLLAFFNAPDELPDHEIAACRAALDALADLQEKKVFSAEGQLKVPFRTRIGLHAGEVLVGNIGTKHRFAYTVLGDVANTASRLEAVNKNYGTSIIASGSVFGKARELFEWRHLDRVAVVGRKGHLEIYELMGHKPGAATDAERLRARDLYEQALALYFQASFAPARELFFQAARARPGEPAAPLMAGRCENLIGTAIPPDWNGVYAFQSKG